MGKIICYTYITPVTDTYMVPNMSCPRLEPDDAKVSSPVLRGEGYGDVCPPTRHEMTHCEYGETQNSKVARRARKLRQ